MKTEKSTVKHSGLKGRRRLLGLMMLSLAGAVYADPVGVSTPSLEPSGEAMTAQVAPENAQPAAPVRSDTLSFKALAPEGSLVLRGVQNASQMTFTVRSDEVVSQAILNLDYTVSPALLPLLSHIKVYLNDELMGVVAVNQESPGKRGTITLPLDARFISDFNRLRLELVGHYKDVCEDPTHSSIWIDVSKASSVALTYQKLDVKNDLSRFPEPFYDSRDFRPLTLPVVFGAEPDVEQQRAAAILTSWFGTKAQWRGQNFPVLFNQLPDSNAVVFATNDRRPDFLRDYPAVSAPTVEMISHPDNPYVKLLLVLGRDDNDLLLAAKGIAQGDPLFRGQSVTIDDVKQLAPRKPYDAPNWVNTDRPVRLGELTSYPEQLSVSGGRLSPIDLDMKLPPDLFLLRSQGVTLDLKYRYTPPAYVDDSRLNVSLNGRFLQAFPLKPYESKSLQVMHIPVIQGLLNAGEEVFIPAFQLGGNNRLRFDFDFVSNIGASTVDVCRTMTPVKHEAIVDEDSTVDFSGYRHYLAMPELKTFAQSGFPFSRMADLSDTLIVIPEKPSAAQLSLMLNVLGQIGSEVGYPALGVTLTASPDDKQYADKDVLLIGALPSAFEPEKEVEVLIEGAKSQLNRPERNRLDVRSVDIAQKPTEPTPQINAAVSSEGAIGAITGFQSPYNEQRSVVALMASGDRGFQLLDGAWRDSGKRAAMAGSVSIVRDSGVSSLRVGDTYYVGYLPWWDKLWYRLSNHPVLMAVMAALSVVLIAIMLWRGLRILSRRRLSGGERPGNEK
ncbi:cellulose biosynthesis cyclic di-GMP-binding regulatory protein BcsB [Leminorella grimontii]|uniref:cellulose biosynthesis cyclic di-GMP-binding regulatory protein BcsB n=1 Tax=Leminorella grimontii TaxID=82981 RepID=UPI00321F9BF5